jgi:hypothetical protein
MAKQTPAEKYIEKLAQSPEADAIKAQNVLCLVNRMAAVHARIRELGASAVHAVGDEKSALVSQLDAQLGHAVATVSALRKLDKSKVKPEWAEYDA